MSGLCMRRRQQGGSRNMGPAATAEPVPLTISQCYTHCPVVKYVQANACPFQATNHPCTIGYPSYNCCNRGSTRCPTAPRLTTNVRKIIKESQEADPTLCQAIDPVVFHQDAPAFSPRVLPRGEKWPALLARVDTAHASPTLTKTAVPNPATLASVGISKINSNRA